MIIDVEMLTSQIEGYANRYPRAVTCGADYIYQNDDARTDALDLVAQIFEHIAEDSEEEEE